MKIYEKSWNFRISQGFLGNLGSMKSTPPSYVQAYAEVTSVDPDRRDLADRVLADNADMRSVHSAASVQRMIEKVRVHARESCGCPCVFGVSEDARDA